MALDQYFLHKVKQRSQTEMENHRVFLRNDSMNRTFPLKEEREKTIFIRKIQFITFVYRMVIENNFTVVEASQE